jgi:putative isomerase
MMDRRTFNKMAGIATLGALAESAAAGRVDEPSAGRGEGADLPPRAVDVVASAVRVMQERGIHTDPTFGSYFSGYGENLFSVEAYFDAIALFHVGEVALGRTALRIYLEQQQDNGFIPRHWEERARTSPSTPPGLVPALELKEAHNPYAMQNPYAIYEREEHAQPFLFQIALFSTRIGGGDVSWLDDAIYAKLKKYLQHWTTDWDRDSNGLCEWASAPHAMGDTQFDRAGVWRSYYCEGADLNSFLYLEFLAAEKIALAKSLADDAASFAAQAKRKLELIQQLLWNEQDGFFYDRDMRTGSPIRVKSVNGLYPLWAGIPNPRQAQRLVREHIMNPQEFWSAHPLPSYALNERNYTQHHVPCPQIDIYYALPDGHCNWRGGLWPHGNYMVTHGLQRYGFIEEARTLARKSFEVAAADPDIYEWYNAETGKTEGAHPLCAGVEVLMRFLPTEIETDFNPVLIDDVHKPIEDGKLRKALSLSENFRKV